MAVLIAILIASIVLVTKLRVIATDSMELIFKVFSVTAYSITVISFILILINIRNQGTSKELKVLIIKRHILYFVFYIAFAFIPLFELSDSNLKIDIIVFVCSGF